MLNPDGKLYNFDGYLPLQPSLLTIFALSRRFSDKNGTSKLALGWRSTPMGSRHYFLEDRNARFLNEIKILRIMNRI